MAGYDRAGKMAAERLTGLWYVGFLHKGSVLNPLGSIEQLAGGVLGVKGH